MQGKIVRIQVLWIDNKNPNKVNYESNSFNLLLVLFIITIRNWEQKNRHSWLP